MFFFSTELQTPQLRFSFDGFTMCNVTVTADFEILCLVQLLVVWICFG